MASANKGIFNGIMNATHFALSMAMNGEQKFSTAMLKKEYEKLVDRGQADIFLEDFLKVARTAFNVAISNGAEPGGGNA